MSPFDLYRQYIALKRHFTTQTYDYFKYDGKIRASLKSFERRKDKPFFHRLTKFRDPINFMAYNFIHSDLWIGEIVINEESIRNYRKHKKIKDSLSYEFRKELKKFPSIREAIFTDGITHPLIIRKYIGEEISLETLVIVSTVMRTISYWKKNHPDDLMMEEVLLKISKFRSFMNFDVEKMKGIMKEVYNE